MGGRRRTEMAHGTPEWITVPGYSFRNLKRPEPAKTPECLIEEDSVQRRTSCATNYWSNPFRQRAKGEHRPPDSGTGAGRGERSGGVCDRVNCGAYIGAESCPGHVADIDIRRGNGGMYPSCRRCGSASWTARSLYGGDGSRRIGRTVRGPGCVACLVLGVLPGNILWWCIRRCRPIISLCSRRRCQSGDAAPCLVIRDGRRGGSRHCRSA